MTHRTDPAYDTAKVLLDALGVKLEPGCGITEVHLRIVSRKYPTLTVVREFWEVDSLEEIQRVVSGYDVHLTPKGELPC